MRIKHPAVAGFFYPDDPDVLQAQVDSYLHAAADRHARRRPKALIVPHAGYPYSGPTAAHAFSTLAPWTDDYHRVAVLAPSHRVALRGIATSSAECFETPLGQIPVDREAVAELNALPNVETLDIAFAEEHALEVELPFLQRMLGGFALIPLIVGAAHSEDVGRVIDTLYDAETLLVISSDLSHFEDYESCHQHDRRTIAQIEALDGDAIGSHDACGVYPMRGLLRVAAARGWEVETLDMSNSGDTAGDRSRVVGYGAFRLC